MRTIFIALISILVLGCQSNVKTEDLKYINGYWEIEKVILKDGTERDYSMNETFDYYEFKAEKGIRMKVKPQLNGKFLVNPNAEKFSIKQENDKLTLIYKTNMSTWKETILSISNEKMVVENTEGIIYNYKRASAINLVDDKKK